MSSVLLILGPVLNSLAIAISIGCILFLWKRIRRNTIIFLVMVQILNILTQISLLISFGLYGKISNPDVIGNQNPIFADLNVNDASFLLFKNLAFIGGHATILGIVICNLEILNLFKVLTETVTPAKISLWKKLSYAWYLILIFPQWLAYFFPIINVAPIPFISSWWIYGTLLWPISAIIYDNIQAGFLTNLVYRSNKYKDKDIVVEELRRMIILNLVTFSLDYVGLAIAIYVQLAAGGDELSYVFNLISFSIPSFHTSLLCIVFVRLKYLALGGKYGKVVTKKTSTSRKVTGPRPSAPKPFVPEPLIKKISLLPSFIMSVQIRDSPEVEQEIIQITDPQLKTSREVILGSILSAQPSKKSDENVSKDKQSNDSNNSERGKKTEIMATQKETQVAAGESPAKDLSIDIQPLPVTNLTNSPSNGVNTAFGAQESQNVQPATVEHIVAHIPTLNSQSSYCNVSSGNNSDMSVASLCPTIKLEDNRKSSLTEPLKRNPHNSRVESKKKNPHSMSHRVISRKNAEIPSANKKTDHPIGSIHWDKTTKSLELDTSVYLDKTTKSLDIDIVSHVGHLAVIKPEDYKIVSESSADPSSPDSLASTTSPIPDIHPYQRSRLASSASQRPPAIIDNAHPKSAMDPIDESSMRDSLASTISSTANFQGSRLSTMSTGYGVPSRPSIASFVLPVPQKPTTVAPITEELNEVSEEIPAIAKPCKSSSLVRIGLGGNVVPITLVPRRPSLLPLDIIPELPPQNKLNTISEGSSQFNAEPEHSVSESAESRSSVNSNAPTIQVASILRAVVSPSARKPQKKDQEHSESIETQAQGTKHTDSIPGLKAVSETAESFSPVAASYRTARSRAISMSSPLRTIIRMQDIIGESSEVLPEQSTSSTNQSRQSITRSKSIGGGSHNTGKSVPKSGRAA